MFKLILAAAICVTALSTTETNLEVGYQVPGETNQVSTPYSEVSEQDKATRLEIAVTENCPACGRQKRTVKRLIRRGYDIQFVEGGADVYPTLTFYNDSGVTESIEGTLTAREIKDRMVKP